MATPVEEIPESTVTPARTQTPQTQKASPNRAVDKRSDVVSAKKKKKRVAHRVALRRSHTNG
jgi:hypothetical protein